MAKQDVELKFSLIDGVSRGLAQIQQGVSGLGASLVKVNAAADLTGKAFGALGSIAGAFGDAVSGAASVEDALKRVSIITRATTQEQSALQQAVSDAVATTRFTAEEAAGALVLMAEDGFTASEAVKQLGTVLQFAQANAQSAAQAAAGLGAVLDTFGAPATQIASLADALTATAVAAGTSTKALQEGLAGAGVAAEQAGLSINDTVAALGGLAQRGIEGGAAAKALNKILADSENPASKLGKALEDAGLAGKSFGEIVGILSNDASKAAPILASLGNKPAAALKALLTEGGGALAQFNEIINQSAGASAAAADSLNTTFLGALTRLQNQLVEARNEFLAPLLAPLAAEFEAFSSKIAAFTSSDQFKILSAQFASFVTDGVGALGDKLAKVDFNDIATKISNFATTAGDAIKSFAVVVDVAASAILGIKRAVDELGLVGDQLYVHFSDAEKATTRFNVANVKFGKHLDEVTAKLRRVRATFADVTVEIPKAQSGTDAFGNALDQLGTAAARANEDLRKVPEAAKLTASGLDTVTSSAREAELGLARLAVNQAAAALAALGANANESSAEFQRLKAEVAAAEENVRRLEAAGIDNKDATDKQAESVRHLREELQRLGGAQGDVVQNNERIANSNSQVSDSFGNIGNQSSEAAVSMGNLTEEYIRNALAAAGASKSVRGYIDTFNEFTAAAEDQERIAQRRLDLLNRQNAALSEEEKIRRRIEQQYGTATTLTEQIVQAEIRLHNQLKANNAERERGIQLAQQASGVVGGFGQQNATATDAGAAATGGKGGGDGAVRGGQTININVQGLPTDRDSWRGIVRDLIEPELRNLRALGK